MDFIGKFERLNKDIAIIKDKFDINTGLEHKRKTKKLLHYSNFYNTFTKEIIENNYGEELEYFGYKFELGTNE